MPAVKIVMGLCAGLLLFRSVDAALNPALYASPWANLWRQSIAYVAAYLFLFCSGFGFVLANLERSVVALDALAHADGLKGCLNRRAADACLLEAVGRAAEHRQSVALVLLDLDHFKQVNDRHGHRVGDEVLRRFAAAVRGVVDAEHRFARLGGEEFGLIVFGAGAPAVRDLAEATRLATRDLQVVDDSGERVEVTVSAGVAVLRPGAATELEAMAAALYWKADAALYLAKSRGRNRVELAGEDDISSTPTQAGRQVASA